MADVTLRVLDGADRGKVYESLPTPVTIGREEGNSVQLNDERISRFHIKIQEDLGKLVLTDLESTNGTRVNGEDAQLRILRYGDVIARLRPGAAESGDIVDLEGRVLGRHDGIVHFTVGQRRGLGLSTGEPRYVVRLDAERRQVVVGPHEALLRRHIRLRDVNWLGQTDTNPDEVHRAYVKIRSTRPAAPASLSVWGRDARVTLDSPEAGVAPGQACVFYEGVGSGVKVLGGGFIASAWLTGNTRHRIEAEEQGRADSDVSEELSV